MGWRWWSVRLGIGGVMIAVALNIQSKEGMWLFAAGLLVVLATIAVGTVRWIGKYAAQPSSESDAHQSTPSCPPPESPSPPP